MIGAIIVTKHNPTKHEPAKPKADESFLKPPADESSLKPRASVAPEKEPAEDLLAELESVRDRELRCRAELDNFRKRAAREYQDGLRYANLPLLQDILPVIDNIDRAIEAAEKNADADALLEGFKLVRQQLEDALARHHCTRIEALDAPFDPNLHHAVMQQPSEDHPANTVIMVTQDGYQLHDRVVRPSQVIVSKAE